MKKPPVLQKKATGSQEEELKGRGGGPIEKKKMRGEVFERKGTADRKKRKGVSRSTRSSYLFSLQKGGNAGPPREKQTRKR